MERIILDTDIGDDIDDAFALAMLLHQRAEVHIEGITTVFRNSMQRAKIAKALLTASGNADIKVYPGADTPRKQKIYIAPFETVGSDGKVNIPHYEEEMSGQEVGDYSATDFILQTLRNYPKQITLVAIGPLLNLAKACEYDSETFSLAKEILFMGGQLQGDYAEWNIKCDPESADIVFHSGVPIKMVTLETTQCCVLTSDDIRTLKMLDTKEAPILRKMLEKWLQDNAFRRPPIMYDPLTVSELTRSFCTFEEISVNLSLCDATRGMLCCGRNEPNSVKMSVSVGVRAREFLDYFLQTICR